jgi:hypothetical protein
MILIEYLIFLGFAMWGVVDLAFRLAKYGGADA